MPVGRTVYLSGNLEFGPFCQLPGRPMLPPLADNPPSIIIQVEQPASTVLGRLNELEDERKAEEARIAEEAAKAAEKARIEALWAAHPAGNDYQPRQCVWWIAKWTKVPAGMRSAKYWWDTAKEWGFDVGLEPKVGAVGVSTRGKWGHVILVTEVFDDGTITLKEGNYNYRGSVRTRKALASAFKYIYFE